MIEMSKLTLGVGIFIFIYAIYKFYSGDSSLWIFITSSWVFYSYNLECKNKALLEYSRRRADNLEKHLEEVRKLLGR